MKLRIRGVLTRASQGKARNWLAKSGYSDYFPYCANRLRGSLALLSKSCNMKDESTIFEEPSGLFAITIPSFWQPVERKEKDTKPFQFGIVGKSFFQISCRKINPDIEQLIAGKKLSFHNPDLPNVSFSETFFEGSLCSHTWMCPVGDHFVLATFFYPLKDRWETITKHQIFIIRIFLQKIRFNYKLIKVKTMKTKHEGKPDYYKIETWRDKPSKVFEFMGDKDKTRWNHKMVSPIEIDTVKLYTLLKLKISSQPNGFNSTSRSGMPLDNMFWWDFMLECDKGFIQIWRTPHAVEAVLSFNGEDFDIVKFFQHNIKAHGKEIADVIKVYDRHQLFINHYVSYKQCVDSLWKDLNQIDLTPPKGPKRHVTIEDPNIYVEGLRSFIDNSVKYHTVAKSLVLHSAFTIESYLNLAIRVGSPAELKSYPEVMDKFLKSDFMFRVKNFGFYSDLLFKEIDPGHKAIKDAQLLMTFRNKYVHSDESSEHNQVGVVLFDGDYPLHQAVDDRPAVESFKQMFHVPDKKTVTRFYETSINFVNYMKSLIHPDMKGDIEFLMEQNPIGYNESLKSYSVVNSGIALDFFGIKRED